MWTAGTAESFSPIFTFLINRQMCLLYTFHTTQLHPGWSENTPGGFETEEVWLHGQLFRIVPLIPWALSSTVKLITWAESLQYLHLIGPRHLQFYKTTLPLSRLLPQQQKAKWIKINILALFCLHSLSLSLSLSLAFKLVFTSQWFFSPFIPHSSKHGNFTS
jgi:hypothetical protein